MCLEINAPHYLCVLTEVRHVRDNEVRCGLECIILSQLLQRKVEHRILHLGFNQRADGVLLEDNFVLRLHCSGQTQHLINRCN